MAYNKKNVNTEATVGARVAIVLIVSCIVLFLLFLNLFDTNDQIITIRQDVCHIENDLSRCTENSTACFEMREYYSGDRFDLQVLETKKITKTFSMAGLESLSIEYIKNYLLQNFDTGNEPICGSALRYYYYDNYGYCFTVAVIRSLSMHRKEVMDSDLLFKTVVIENITGSDIRIDGDTIKNLRYDKNDIKVDILINKYSLVRKNITVCNVQEVDKIDVQAINCSYLEQKEKELKTRIDKFTEECGNFENVTIVIDNKFQIRDEVYRCLILRQEIFTDTLSFSNERDNCYAYALKNNYEMSKENITVEWLDNNCIKEQSCICHNPNGCEVEAIVNCLLYTCNNYTVEVQND